MLGSITLTWQEIEALQECHICHAYAKFWGKCNQQKWDLDACLRKEKSINRWVD